MKKIPIFLLCFLTEISVWAQEKIYPDLITIPVFNKEIPGLSNLVDTSDTLLALNRFDSLKLGIVKENQSPDNQVSTNDTRPFIAISDTSFYILYGKIKNQWPETNRIIFLANILQSSHEYFSALQASQLIQLVSPDSNRLLLAKLFYHVIIDMANFSQIYNLFSQQINEDRLADYVLDNYNTSVRLRITY